MHMYAVCIYIYTHTYHKCTDIYMGGHKRTLMEFGLVGRDRQFTSNNYHGHSLDCLRG